MADTKKAPPIRPSKTKSRRVVKLVIALFLGVIVASIVLFRPTSAKKNKIIIDHFLEEGSKQLRTTRLDHVQNQHFRTGRALPQCPWGIAYMVEEGSPGVFKLIEKHAPALVYVNAAHDKALIIAKGMSLMSVARMYALIELTIRDEIVTLNTYLPEHRIFEKDGAVLLDIEEDGFAKFYNQLLLMTRQPSGVASLGMVSGSRQINLTEVFKDSFQEKLLSDPARFTLENVAVLER